MRLFSWALYDLANTFFAVAMLSFFFPLWVIEDHGAKELLYGVAVASSMLCVAVLMPFCGAVSDAMGSRMRLLRWTTIGCVGCTFLIGYTDQLAPALGLFIVANICYQLGTVFYDALLWQLAGPTRLGQVSGFGASFGYLGSMMGLLFLWPFVQRGGNAAAFIPSALFFLVFALPSFFVIREPAPRRRVDWSAAVQGAWQRLVETWRHARAYAGLFRFLAASFFSLSAINTILVFMAVYIKTVLHFEQGEVIRFFLWGQGFAVVGALVGGRMTAWLGAKQTLAGIWAGWAIALAIVGVGASVRWLWVAAPLVGFCLGSTWSTSRVLIVQLSPKDRLGEFLGLAGLLGRASGILGPLLWGVIVWDPSRYGHAMAAMIALLAIGLWILRGVPDPRAARSAV